MQIRLVVLFALMVILPMLVFAWGEYSGHPGWAAPPMLLLSVVGTLLARRWPVAVLLLLPSVALAEQPSVIAPPPTGSVSAVALGLLGPVVGFIVQNWGLALAVALLGGAAWVAKKLLAEAATLTAKAPAGAPRHAALAILEAARVGVGYVEQKVAPTLRGQDGKLSPEAQNAAKAAAIQAALEWLGMQGLDTAKAAWGLTDEQLLKQLGVAIEAEVASGPAKAPGVAPVPIEEATGPAEKEIRTAPSGRPIVAVAGKGG